MAKIPREKFKPQNEDVYLYIYNHCIYTIPGYMHLGAVRDKQMMLSILYRHLQKYNIKVLSYAIMPDQYHLCLLIKKELLTEKQMAAAYKKFTYGKQHLKPDNENLQRLHKKSNDISELMLGFQRDFGIWYNKTRTPKRSGTLWFDSFKCTKLVGHSAVATWMKYIDLTPVRLGACQKPEDYQFSSYSQWHHCGRHPFEQNIHRYFMPTVQHHFKGNEITDLKEYLDNTYCAAIAGNKKQATRAPKSKPQEIKSLLHESPYWTDSLLISDKEHYRHEVELMLGPQKSSKHSECKCYDDNKETLYSLRHLKHSR